MITEEEYKRAQEIVDQYHEEQQREADLDMDDDDDDIVEECDDCGRINCICDIASGCTCGAWVWSSKGLAHVSDCICGGGL